MYLMNANLTLIAVPFPQMFTLQTVLESFEGSGLILELEETWVPCVVFVPFDAYEERTEIDFRVLNSE